MIRKTHNLKSQISNRRGKAMPGFTLVEVLVVIAIIGILVGLLVPAVMRAQVAARTTVVKAEMTQLVAALESFKTSIGGGQYPPDGSSVAGPDPQADVKQFCKAAWPRAAWGGTVNFPTITPDTALCFWLGGAQDANGGFIGFSSNPNNPFDASQSRQPALYEFDKNRVAKSSTSSGLSGGSGVNWNLYQYYPPNKKDITSGTYAPYLYFKAVAGQYSTTAVSNGQPYMDSASTFVNPLNYQLLCPGLDGVYGKTKDGKPPQYPSGSNYDLANGLDDMTNFTKNPTVGDDAK